MPSTHALTAAMQNAMLSLPLVNGAALGCDAAAAPPQLHAALRQALHSLRGVAPAVEALMGPGADVAGGAETSARGMQGGVPAMAALLPQLQQALAGAWGHSCGSSPACVRAVHSSSGCSPCTAVRAPCGEFTSSPSLCALPVSQCRAAVPRATSLNRCVNQANNEIIRR